MKKVSIVGTVGIPACYGGFESLVENLTHYNIEESLVEYSVYCSSHSYKDKKNFYNNAKLIYVPLDANGISSVLYDVFSLFHCLKTKPDTILILGVSGCIVLPIIKKISNSKIITNIDGLEWKRSKWGKLARIFLKFSEKMAVKYSDVIIADNQAIADYLSQHYGVGSEVIAYGGDHAILPNELKNNNAFPHTSKYDLGLCRIEPENNVEMILEAYKNANHAIKFIGNWSNSQYGINLKEYYSKFPNIELIDPIYDVGKLKILRSNCEIYLHGHSAGGTNPSLVEMMHFSKPIFCYDCAYNRATTENKAIYFKDADDLLNKIKGFSIHNNSIGQSMRDIAQKRYVWRIICEQYGTLY
ncbi:DUF1972 domain-containing protein [Pantoea sp. FN0305]|uniref:DUF1972 domain-containing protein n=1 Tax=Pantoea sp. FN0305 TaxID=3418559 RepID=UPI003CF0842D